VIIVVVSPFKVGGRVGVEVSDVATVWSVLGMAMSGVLIRFGFRWLAVVMIVIMIVVVIMACSRFVF
jgi:hypothetical protein